MPNPLTGANVTAAFTVTNPTASTPDARRFKVADVWLAVAGPDGLAYDFGHSGPVWVETSGYAYSSTRSFPKSGTHTFKPSLTLESGALVQGASGTLTIAQATTTRVYNDDGSVVDTTTYTDGRPPVSVQIYGPVIPTFSASGVA